MKKTKRIISAIMALTACATMSLSVSAAVTPDGGTPGVNRGNQVEEGYSKGGSVKAWVQAKSQWQSGPTASSWLYCAHPGKMYVSTNAYDTNGGSHPGFNSVTNRQINQLECNVNCASFTPSYELGGYTYVSSLCGEWGSGTKAYY
ncbi:hypothetical protein [Solibaculum intestinale]|uniref:Uncharacterized protein n=1 Tax=Solibaculum intestinale TaxID=3133165 RepID=A0ABV1E239_9FIRM